MGEVPTENVGKKKERKFNCLINFSYVRSLFYWLVIIYAKLYKNDNTRKKFSLTTIF